MADRFNIATLFYIIPFITLFQTGHGRRKVSASAEITPSQSNGLPTRSPANEVDIAKTQLFQPQIFLFSERSRAQAQADVLYRGDSQQSLLSAVSNDTFFQAVQDAKSNRMSFSELYERVTGARPDSSPNPPSYALPPEYPPRAAPYYPMRSMSEDVLRERSPPPRTSRGGGGDRARTIVRRDSAVQTDDEDNVADAAYWFERRTGFDRRRAGRTTSDQAIQTDDDDSVLHLSSASALRRRTDPRRSVSSVALQTSFNSEPDVAEIAPIAYESSAPPMDFSSPTDSPALPARRSSRASILREQSFRAPPDKSGQLLDDAKKAKRQEMAKVCDCVELVFFINLRDSLAYRRKESRHWIRNVCEKL